MTQNTNSNMTTLPYQPSTPEERYKNIRPAWEVKVEALEEKVKQLGKIVGRHTTLLTKLTMANENVLYDVLKNDFK